ncbi:MAG: cbb3-type cytochrome c oxidase subunit I [Bacteroidetes bacterium]|nr:cbb3-type cytochrome c oxidase subunit I [Bacteroidota bacterium]
MNNILKLKKITSAWILAILLLFVLAISFGITMRFNQANDIKLSPVTFYSLMTTHGVTMVGIWVVAGMMAVNYLLSRYVKVSNGLNLFAMALTVIGVVMLWLTTFVGHYHTGWTFLYPLPFYTAWEKWATPVFLLSLGVLGIGWFVWSVGMLWQILKRYSLPQAFAWQHFKKGHTVETPPFILITTVTLVGVIACLLTAVLLLILYFAEYFSKGTFTNDALLMKNLTYFFGHTIINEALYLGVATLYELLPEVSGRPKFKMTWYVAVAWNCTLLFVLTAFFHHLYMDFAQPQSFQIIGQVASYFASLPSASVTAFSVIVLIYKNPVKWSLTNLLFVVGVAGWLIGGIGAVIDATISNNFVLHNTLWVPAHFHTYNAMGNVLFSLAFFNWAAKDFQGIASPLRYDKTKIFWLMVGGFGFVLMFYIGGAYSIPRRYAEYPNEFTNAKLLASAGAWFAIIYLWAIIVILFNIVMKCIKMFSVSE